MPQHDRMLLAHEHHMTVTVEKFHRCLVDVRVLATNLTEKLYARKILLTRQSDSRIVQFGSFSIRRRAALALSLRAAGLRMTRISCMAARAITPFLSQGLPPYGQQTSSHA
jgi:hypothetical protein